LLTFLSALIIFQTACYHGHLCKGNYILFKPCHYQFKPFQLYFNFISYLIQTQIQIQIQILLFSNTNQCSVDLLLCPLALMLSILSFLNLLSFCYSILFLLFNSHSHYLWYSLSLIFFAMFIATLVTLLWQAIALLPSCPVDRWYSLLQLILYNSIQFKSNQIKLYFF